MSSHLVWIDAPEQCDELVELRAAGVGQLREDFPWELVERTRGRLDWTRTDALVLRAASLGIEILPIAGYSAPWASSRPDAQRATKYPPADHGDYARYVRALVQRYGPEGRLWDEHPDVAPVPVRAVELWNEPWGYWAWKPEPDPAAYARLALGAARAVKEATPSVEVVIAGDAEQRRSDDRHPPWLTAVAAAEPDLLNLVDILSLHPYPEPRDGAVEGALARLDQALTAQQGLSRRPRTWITEIGWSTAPEDDEGVTEAAQAARLGEFARVALTRPGVERLYAYTWNTDGDDPTELEEHYGVRHADGTPKPAWLTLRTLLRETARA